MAQHVLPCPSGCGVVLSLNVILQAGYLPAMTRSRHGGLIPRRIPVFDTWLNDNPLKAHFAAAHPGEVAGVAH